MSKASAVGTVIFIEQAGVFMPTLMCNYGDLYQEYLGDPSSPNNIAPDFSVLKPIISYIITNSRSAEGIVTPSSVKWSFNGVELAFTNNVSTNNFGGETGHFALIDKASNGGYYGLQILKNLVSASEGAACTIKAEATISVGNTSDVIQQVCSIPITKSVGNQKHVSIVAGDDKYFTLKDKDDSCILKAVARSGSDELSGSLTYKWYVLTNGNWILMSGYTSQSITVTSDMVDTTAMFKAEVYLSSNIIGQDVQLVLDASDPFDILVNSDPEDKCIRNAGDTVVLSPILVKRGSTTKYKDVDFYFTIMDSAGIILNVGSNTVKNKTYTVTYDDCIQAGGSVTYTIVTAE